MAGMSYWRGIEWVPTADDWNVHHGLLMTLDLQLNLSVAEIRLYMRHAYGLIATEDMYRTQLQAWRGNRKERKRKPRNFNAKGSRKRFLGPKHLQHNVIPGASNANPAAPHVASSKDGAQQQSSPSNTNRSQSSRQMRSNSIDAIRKEVSQVLAASDEPTRSPSPTPDQCYVNSIIKQLNTLYGEYAGTLAVSPTWCLCCSPFRNPAAPAVCSSEAISDLSVRTHASMYLLQHPNPSSTMLSFLRKFGPDLAKSFQNPGPWLVPRLASLAMFLQTILSAWEARAEADAAANMNSAATATATITNALRAAKRYIVRAMAERVGPTHPLAVLSEAIFDSSSAHRAHSVVTHALQQYASAVQSWYEGDSTILEHYDAQTRLALVAQMDAMTAAKTSSAAPETNNSSSGKRCNSTSSPEAGAEAEADAKAATAASASAVRMLQHGIHGVRHSFALVDEAARMQSLAWSYWIIANAYAGASDAQRAEEAFMASMHHTYRLYAAADTQRPLPEAAVPAMSPSTGTATGEPEAKVKSERGRNESWQPGRMGCHYGVRGIVSLYRSQGAWSQCEAASRLAVQTYAGLFGRRDLRTLEMVHVLGDCLAQQGKDSESAALLRQWGPDFADAG